MYYFDWKKQYETYDSTFPNHEKRPVIGLTGNWGEKGCELAEGYFQSIIAAGGIPVILPPTEEKEVILGWLDRIDGLLLSGGADLNPLFTGEQPLPGLHGINPRRDLSELLLIRFAYDRQIPILGICRGIQMLAVALDGTVYQDLDSQYKEAPLIKHSQDLERSYPSHTVCIEPETILSEIFQTDNLTVNSFHHQAVHDSGPCLKVTAKSVDGVIEAVESTEYKSIIGVQWHPECFVLRGDETMKPLFKWLIEESVSYAGARELHRNILTLDSHCDTPMFFDKKIHFDHRDPQLLVDLHKMTEGGLDASIMVAYLKQEGRSDKELLEATEKANTILSEIETMVNACNGVEIAYTPADLYRLKQEGKHAIMMGIENGYAIGKDIKNIEAFRKRGVVYMTLCHNGSNDICDSARGEAEHKGVSEFGAFVIEEMNRTGMMVDLSHAAEASFYDSLNISHMPIICSHSSARALCDHPRNLTDDQLWALAKAGGVAQVTLYHGFLRSEGEATVLDAVEHLNHMIAIAGIDHVGIGTDFDGDGGIRGCASASELINFTRRLLAARYSKSDMEKIWGGNFLRVMKQVQG